MSISSVPWRIPVRKASLKGVSPRKISKREASPGISYKLSDKDLGQVILKLWGVYGQNIIDVPKCETEPRCQLVFLPFKNKDCINSVSICRLEEGHKWFPVECLLSAGKPFPPKPGKCCRSETRAFWWYHLQCTCSRSYSVFETQY